MTVTARYGTRHGAKEMAGFGDLDVMQRGRRLGVGVVMLVLGGIVGYAWPQSSATPGSQKGEVTAVGNPVANVGVRFTFQPAKAKSPSEQFLLQNGTPWRAKPDRPWRSKGLPPCMVPGAPATAAATIGVVGVRGTAGAQGRSVVV